MQLMNYMYILSAEETVELSPLRTEELAIRHALPLLPFISR